MSRSLCGWRIWVPRASEQAGPLCELIRAHDGDPLCLPALRIQPLEAGWPFDTPPDWVIFVSTNAVEHGFTRFPELNRYLGAVAAIGRATRAALLSRCGAGVRVTMPSGGFDSEALLAMPEMQEVAGRRVLIVKGEGGRRDLADALRARGAEVIEQAVYRRALPEYPRVRLDAAFATPLDAALATSGEVLDNMRRLLGGRGCCRDTLLITPSRRVAARPAATAFGRVIVSREPGDAAMFDALLEARGASAPDGSSP